MVKLDLKRFWAENAASCGKPFRTDKPRCPISLALDDHWLSDEMKLPSTLRYYRDAEYRLQVHRQCNDRCEEAIGIRPFGESPAPPPPLRIEQVFGCRIELTENSTPWLEPGVSTPDELSQLLDRIERLDDAGLRDLIFSNGGRVQRQEPLPDGRLRTHNPSSRGPATVGTSVIGTTQYAYWLVDEPALMERFYEVLAETLVRYHRILGREMNVEIRGFSWLDDNCALLSPAMYERFCFPVMKRVFDEFCPGPDDRRFQHSDSAMAHLLPILSRLNFHAVNFGPTVSAAEIRRHMPRTEIHGQVAPNTVRNGTLADVVAEVKRDFAAVGADGGLHVTTAGSISAGTSLDSIRGFMWAVQEHTRYDR